jgi:hypothetical protein
MPNQLYGTLLVNMVKPKHVLKVLFGREKIVF